MRRSIVIVASVIASVSVWVSASVASIGTGTGAASTNAAGPTSLRIGGIEGAFFGTGSGLAGQFSAPVSTAITTIPIRVQGQLVVRFHGDPHAGCAARGVCSYAGTVIWQPPRAGSLVMFTLRARHQVLREASIDLTDFASDPTPQGAVATAAVHSASSGPGATPSDCTDAAAVGGDVEIPFHGATGSLTLANADPGTTLTQCAGPLAPDFRRALAERSLTLHALTHGDAAVSLASSGAFAGGGFRGTVASTVRLSLGQARTMTASNPSGKSVLVRTVDVRYRATITGRVLSRVRGDPSSCSGLGSCGATESFQLIPHAGTGVLEVSAITKASRSLTDELTALGLRQGGNPRGINPSGAIDLPGPTRFAVALSQGAMSCRDTVRSDEPDIELALGSRSLNATYASSGELHTRCAGPLVAQGGTLASGTAPLSLLGRRGATISLGRGVPLLDAGYEGETVSNLQIRLTGRRVKIHLERLPSS
jgi:hypothetical protein